MTINDRVKLLRTTLKMTQKDFGQRTTLAQTYLSQIEKGDRDVTEKIFKIICSEFDVNEYWLRTGEGKMFIEPETISLDDYAKKHNMSDLDFRIIKAYLSLDENVRENIIEKFKAALDNEKDTEIAASIEDNINKNDDDIEKEVQAYRLEMEAMKKGTTLSASEKLNKNLG